jgi:predicted NAD-dependent protein-ADP-ribosyltransferase YbiA (DUF1768 family)
MPRGRQKDSPLDDAMGNADSCKKKRPAPVATKKRTVPDVPKFGPAASRKRPKVEVGPVVTMEMLEKEDIRHDYTNGGPTTFTTDVLPVGRKRCMDPATYSPFYEKVIDTSESAPKKSRYTHPNIKLDVKTKIRPRGVTDEAIDVEAEDFHEDQPIYDVENEAKRAQANNTMDRDMNDPFKHISRMEDGSINVYFRKKDERYIYIYGHGDGYGFMSPRKYDPFYFDGVTFRTLTHFTQYYKYLMYPNAQWEIRHADNTGDVQYIVRKYKIPIFLEAMWKSHVGVMTMDKAIRCKLQQKYGLVERLIATGTRPIRLANGARSIWGVDADGEGFNAVGKLFMRYRDEERAKRGMSTMKSLGTDHHYSDVGDRRPMQVELILSRGRNKGL